MVSVKVLRSCALAVLSLFSLTATAHSQTDASEAGPRLATTRYIARSSGTEGRADR